jgi:hypothetical protein
MKLSHLQLALCLLGYLFVTGTAVSRDVVTPWDPGHEHRLQSWVQPELLREMTLRLQLSEAQVERVEGFARAHRTRFDELVERSQPTIVDYQQRGSRLRGRTFEKWNLDVERESALALIADEQVALDQRFFDDVQEILSEGQLERWPGFVQRFNRHRWIRASETFLEEPIDVVELVETLAESNELDLRDLGVTELLALYAEELDRHLSHRAKSQIQRLRHWARTMMKRVETDAAGNAWIGPHPQGDTAFRRERLQELRLHQQVRDVNRSFADIVYAALPEEYRDTFRRAYDERVLAVAGFRGGKELRFPAVIEKARAIETLTSEQRDGLDAFAADFGLRLHLAVAELIRRHDAFAAEKYAGDLNKKSIFEQRFKEMVADIRKLDESFIEHVRLLLGAEQVDLIGSVFSRESSSRP